MTAGILGITALAKIFSVVLSSSALLFQPDPVFGVNNRILLAWASLGEILVIALIFLPFSQNVKLGVVCFIATQFLIYRFLAWDVKYCSCFGTLWSDVPLLSGNEWIISLAFALFLFLGSSILLFYNSKLRHSPVLTSSAVQRS
ncbi:MAG: hypothetical protein SFY81_09965 [Verrucomicrobiota bacterium]|nr:hypothetical protein [Verrucomicrobiota bacterium]